MAFSARAISTNLLQQQVVQTAHNFIVGDVLAFDGTNYFLAQADNQSDAETVGIVSFVLDANNFYITQAGHVNDLTGPLTPGSLYYLSAVSAGGLTTVAPSTPGQYVVPLLIADTTTSGYYFNNAGRVVGGGSSGFTWSVVTTNTSMAVNNGYIINGGGLLTMTLPASAIPGDIVRIGGFSASGWSIVYGTNQIIHYGINDTTVTTGSLSSAQRYDTVELINVVANTNWLVLSNQGNLTIV